ncbi:hypothetical protein AVEN_242819-1 [Araneus ventricosus]|uniref:Transposase Tc1-like domain-containing protein n=1 Tax=Araneus ventricosus TaxID=182803 RepID=A0A4Y2WSF3_ARAVE|nr:hypothetical protein AVEN_242819-1 [Araneus ventricosus]
MGKTRDLSDFEQEMIVGAIRSGASISETTTLLGFSRLAVSRVCRGWQLKKNPSKRYGLFWSKKAGTSQSISQRTTRRTLERVVISSRRPSRVPLVSQKNRKRRLFWAQKRRNWSLEDWKKVSWSDESRFLLHHTDGRIRIWRKQYEFRDRPSCQMTPLQAGGVMVWGMISWSALGPLISMDTTMNSTAYLNIIADHVHSLIFS